MTASSNPTRLPRCVRFAPMAITIACVTPSYHCWYMESEIETFRSQCVSMCEQLRMNRLRKHRICKEDAAASSADDDHHCLQGLERLMSRERQQNQTLAIRAILAAQHSFRANSEQLANASRRCTAWAREIARNTAIVYYYQVYFPAQAEAMQPAPPSSLCPLAFLKQRLQERRVQESTHHHLSVRTHVLTKIDDR